MRYHYIEWLILEWLKLKSGCFGDNVEEPELSYTAGGNVKWFLVS